MRSDRKRWTALGAMLASLRAGAAHAQANAPPDDEGRKACGVAYESAQLRRRDQQLLDARRQLRVCGAETCPAIVRSDCVQWLGQIEAGIPSVVFEALTDTGAIFDVTARIDGAVVATQFDGRAIELDPGLHRVIFERAGRRTLEQSFIVREGEKNRLVVADWSTPEPSLSASLAAPARAERPIPPAVYASAAVAALGFLDFAIAGALGDSLKGELDASHCAPFCARGKTNALTARYIVADIGLGIGVVEAATSAVLFFARPERPEKQRTNAPRRGEPTAGKLVGGATPSGAFVGWRGLF